MERTVAVLLSRQSLCPDGATGWVRQVLRALDWVANERMTLGSSAGQPTWDLITAGASLRKIPMRLLIPSTLASLAVCESDLLYQFDLDQTRTSVSIVVGSRPRASATSRMSLRDRAIVQSADLLLPVSISPDGSMAQLLQQAEREQKPICRDFEIPYCAHHEAIAYRLPADGLNPSLDSLASRYLIHWTRTPHGPWPDERRIDYYRAIFESTTYPRSALATLGHIIATGRIQASSRHMPANEPCVSFSSSLPSELLPLMRWRARYRQMSFEPYGVGIERDIARAAGIEPVVYTEPDSPAPSDVPVWRRQSVGKVTDWRNEKEHRCRSDFNLAGIPPDALALFCRTNDEAEQLRRSFGLTTISFYS